MSCSCWASCSFCAGRSCWVRLMGRSSRGASTTPTSPRGSPGLSCVAGIARNSAAAPWRGARGSFGGGPTSATHLPRMARRNARRLSLSNPRWLSLSDPRWLSLSDPRWLSLSNPRGLSLSKPRWLSLSKPRSQRLLKFLDRHVQLDQKVQVRRCGAPQSGQVVADNHCVDAAQEPFTGAEIAEREFAPTGVAENRAWHGKPERGDGAQGVLAVHDSLVFQRGARAGVEEVQGHLIRLKCGQLRGE